MASSKRTLRVAASYVADGMETSSSPVSALSCSSRPWIEVKLGSPGVGSPAVAGGTAVSRKSVICLTTPTALA
jgi:hypothetical protein